MLASASGSVKGDAGRGRPEDPAVACGLLAFLALSPSLWSE